MKPPEPTTSNAPGEPFADLAQKFPSSRYHPEARLVTWFPEGIFDADRANAIVEFLEGEEKAGELPFNRFADVSGYLRIELSCDHLFNVAQRRKDFYRGGPVKSAFLADRLISLGIAQIYLELMRDTPIEVRIFRERQAAATWLGVPLETLQRRYPN